MPYEVTGPNANGKFTVVNSETKEEKAVRDTKEAAERTVRILRAVESDGNWEGTSDDNA